MATQSSIAPEPGRTGRGSTGLSGAPDTIIPLTKALLGDAEALFRNELKLLEVRLSRRVEALEYRAVTLVLGAGILLSALGLLIATCAFALRGAFPLAPTWMITGGMSIVVCLFGILIVRGGTTSRSGTSSEHK